MYRFAIAIGQVKSFYNKFFKLNPAVNLKLIFITQYILSTEVAARQ